MVRRVGFGGDEKPNKRDAELRRRYHKTDGNHSDRAHPNSDETNTAAPPMPESPPIPSKKPAPYRVIVWLIVGFFVMPIVLTTLIWLFGSLFDGGPGGSVGIVGLIVIVLIVRKIYNFIKKVLMRAAQ